MQTIPEVNLGSPKFKADPYPFYAQLRAEAPVHKTRLPNGLPVWLLTRYDDVLMALKDTDRFTNDRRLAMTPAQLKRQPWVPPMVKRFGRTLLGLDGTEHSRLRGLIHKAFTPRLVEQMRTQVQSLSDQLIDDAERQGRMDIVRNYALPIPLTIIAQILGIPEKDQEKFHGWTRAFMQLGSSVSLIALVPTVIALNSYLRKLFKLRAADPQDDLVASLLQAEIDGDHMTEDELLAMVFLLLVGGHETTVNLIGSGMLALLENQDQMRLLNNQPDLIRPAIEELLRFTNPVEQSTKRYAREELTLHGVTIPRGDMLLLVLASANRDESQFADPNRLDITRQENRHLGFGMGAHYCVGAPLARLEGQIAISTMIRRLPALKLGMEPARLRWNSGMTVRGLEALPVAL